MGQNKTIATQEWALRNYLNKHDIFRKYSEMQTMVINSFYNEHRSKKDKRDVNNDDWIEKVKYVQDNFGLFAQYAQNNWKQKTNK